MKLWKRVLAVAFAGIVGFSGLQLPLAGGNSLYVSADELTDGLTFTVSGGEATVTGCTSTASEIVIPSEYEGYPVTAIGENAFYHCDSLVTVTIPQGVTTLGYYAFESCNNLRTIYMPVSVTSWGYGVSYDCLSLSDVYYEGTASQWDAISSDGGNGYLLNEATIHYDYVYPINGTLDGLEFLVRDGEATVTGCTSTVSEIVIPSEYEGYPVTAIGEKAFYDCDTLVSITIPQGVTTLEDYAFGYCDNLTTIYMPVSVTGLRYGVFYDCLNLSDVYYEGTSNQWYATTIYGGNNYLLDEATIHYNYMYPSSGTLDGLKFLVRDGEATVTGCTSTASEIVIPSEYEGYPVTAIGEKAFYDCDTLVSVTIPQDVTTLGDYAFGYCDNLTAIYMPVSVTSWGYGVSYDCLSLSDVYYEGTSTEWENIDQGEANGYLLNIATTHYNYVYPDGTGTSSGLTFTVSSGAATVTGCTSTASKIVIPSEYEGYPVTAIGEKAFYDCDTLVSVTIPQGVTTLGDYAFGYCDNLTTIYMPVSVTSWGYGVSYDCLSLSDVYYEGTFTEWENIDQGEANGYLQSIATKHYNAYDTAGTQSVWSLGKMTVRPEDGMEEDLNFDICIKNAMDSYGLQGAIWLPEITARLLYWPYMADSALVGDVYNSARLTANMNKVLYDEGNEIYFALDSSSLMTPETDSGVLMQLTFSVPDEETVVALAEEYGLELETDEYGTYYYEFPVCWMENGYDEAISDGEIIELPRYAYVNSDNQDVFSDNVVLEDGYIRVEMPLYEETTETTTVETTTPTTTSNWMTTPTTYTTTTDWMTTPTTYTTTTDWMTTPTTYTTTTDWMTTPTTYTTTTDWMTTPTTYTTTTDWMTTPTTYTTTTDWMTTPTTYTTTTDWMTTPTTYTTTTDWMTTPTTYTTTTDWMTTPTTYTTTSERTTTSTSYITTSTTETTYTTTNTTATTETTDTTAITETTATVTTKNDSGVYIELGKPDASQLYAGNSFRLLYSTNAKNLIWKSTDDSIATVDDSGMLTILGSGTVSVIVIVQEDPTQTDTITITIPETLQTTDTTSDTAGDTGTTTTTTPSVETGVRGDADLDGDVDADDAYQVLVYYARHSVGDTAYTFQGNAALEAQVVQQADVNQSGTVDADDAYLILCYYARVSVGMTDVRWEDLM